MEVSEDCYDAGDDALLSICQLITIITYIHLRVSYRVFSLYGLSSDISSLVE